MNRTGSGRSTAAASAVAASSERDGLMGHEQPIPGELLVQPGGRDRLELLLENPVDLPVQDARPGEDEPARVAERAV
jgi:hypothetical protein